VGNFQPTTFANDDVVFVYYIYIYINHLCCAYSKTVNGIVLGVSD
jgi:hypothetical protein